MTFWNFNPRPRRPGNGIKAKTRRGSFGQSWWARKWIGALEAFGWEWQSRLQRGRTYARAGQVVSLDVEPGAVSARVQGSMPRPYSVQIRLPLLSDAQWREAATAMAGQAIFAAKLLAGEMPPDIEEAFAAANVPLFPQETGDLDSSCSCPDFANPCKHIAAVHYLLAEQFDQDPFLLFKLRGRTKEAIMAAIRARRAERTAAADESAEEDEPETGGSEPGLADLLAAYYSPAGELKFIIPSIAPPKIEAPLLRRLGPPPGVAAAELSALYRAMSDYAIDRLLGDADAAGKH